MTFKAKPIKWSSKTTDMWIGIAGPWTFTVTFQGEGEMLSHTTRISTGSHLGEGAPRRKPWTCAGTIWTRRSAP
jgi:hypothetical protein